MSEFRRNAISVWARPLQVAVALSLCFSIALSVPLLTLLDRLTHAASATHDETQGALAGESDDGDADLAKTDCPNCLMDLAILQDFQLFQPGAAQRLTPLSRAVPHAPAPEPLLPPPRRARA